MTSELKKLSKEYFEQDNRGTAYPIYFAIRDIEYVPSHYFEEGDRFTMVWDTEPTHSADSIEGLFKKLIEDKEEYGFEGLDNIDFEYELTESDCDDFVRANRDYCHGIFSEKEQWINKNMFLFADEAEQHLKANYYHYSDKAHTYGLHAWRAPKTEAFLNSARKLTEAQSTRHISDDMVEKATFAVVNYLMKEAPEKLKLGTLGFDMRPLVEAALTAALKGENVSPTRVLAKEALSSLEAYEARERKMCDAVEKALAVLKDMYSMELAEPEIMHNLEQTLNEIKK